MSVEAVDPAGPDPVVLVVPAPVTLADVPPLCARLYALYGEGAAEVVCDLAELTRANLASVEAVARLRLTARRAGRAVRMRNAGPELQALLTLMGLDCLTQRGDDSLSHGVTQPAAPAPDAATPTDPTPGDLAQSGAYAQRDGPAPS
ncbi:STAS domain-containing protein [Streptomyces albipurpureus]|uniref:STAS domain-containing protein n=1 Tax=Streptomyces albipurpureus TaxID=2897419 RepID=UPI0027E4F762|nr:STAS domain-containing protein [Streptomyces sp. CWNU-1]